MKIEKSKLLIEKEEFPIEFVSLLGKKESWRKEIYRPIYHVHKWWAKRLGSVFRGIILGCFESDVDKFENAFYSAPIRRDKIVLDPFMGGGTTLGEAHKLGCVAIGSDINPVACETVRVSQSTVNELLLNQIFQQLTMTVGKRISDLYRCKDELEEDCDVLYFFWVKRVACPSCESNVDLFKTPIFAKNARPKLKPEVRVCCPGCGGIFDSNNNYESDECPHCNMAVLLHTGPVAGSKAVCSECNHMFSIASTIRMSKEPPSHRMYAKLVLTKSGEKKYLRADREDELSYRRCAELLESEVKAGKIRLPVNVLKEGYNTNQAIGYNYKQWRDFFNDRQLLALGWLQAAIAEVENDSVRDALMLLFSGTLEFNNLFASYKGEGTGAVRHMFSHHVLKPERTPIEANLWGTKKSSGSFTTLFKSRLIRAIDYRAFPTEISLKSPSNKVRGCNFAFNGSVVSEFPKSGEFEADGIYLNCGSSDKLDLKDNSIDLIITDPPFFDNVHYSELADFFLAWQTLYPTGFIRKSKTSRSSSEVQDRDSQEFSKKLASVFVESSRVLKDDGLFVFSYHHSRTEGWSSVAFALAEAGLAVVNSHPVKSEMSVATPKSQAKEPIQFDIILVCRKRDFDFREELTPSECWTNARQAAARQESRLSKVGFKLSENDRKIILYGQIMAFFSALKNQELLNHVLNDCELEKLDEGLPVFEHASNF